MKSSCSSCLILAVLAFNILLNLNCSLSAEQQPPNILFCIADDASFPHMSAYGCKWVKTPGFDRVAKQGILFTNAYTPNAKCAPSRACILTGRNSWQLKEAANHFPYFPKEFKSYCEALSENGYFVGKTAKGFAPGKALDDKGKRRQLTGRPYDRIRTQPPTNSMSKIDYAANFKKFLDDSKKSKKPWCFWYGGFEPHRRYEYGSGVTKGKKKLDEIDKVFEFWPDNEKIRNDILDYAYEIEYFDSHLRKMLAMIESSGQLDNTIVVVTADNGMPFPRVKGQEYELSNHLPLAIMWPKGIKNRGRVVNDYVSFIDFAPTFIEIAGLKWEETGMKPTVGKSLTDIFNSEKSGQVNPVRDHVLIGKERHDIGRPNDWGYPIRGIVKNKMLFLKNFEPNRWPGGNPETGYLNCDGSPTKSEVLRMRIDKPSAKYWALAFGKRPGIELYDLSNDRECTNNLASSKKFQKQRKELQDELYAKLKSQNDPRMFGKGEVFDNYEYSDLRTRNFYKRFMAREKLKAGWVNASDFEKEAISGDGKPRK